MVSFLYSFLNIVSKRSPQCLEKLKDEHYDVNAKFTLEQAMKAQRGGGEV